MTNMMLSAMDTLGVQPTSSATSPAASRLRGISTQLGPCVSHLYWDCWATLTLAGLALGWCAGRPSAAGGEDRRPRNHQEPAGGACRCECAVAGQVHGAWPGPSIARTRAVRLLLDAGAKPDVSDVEGATPLGWPANSAIPSLSMICSRPAPTPRRRGLTASRRWRCVRVRHAEALAALIARAPTSMPPTSGPDRADARAASGRTDNVAFLIAHGANVNAVGTEGFTPLFFALRSKEPEGPPVSC